MILAIGLIGMVLMSLVMKHLVEVTSERSRSPYASAVEARLGSRRVGKVIIEEESVRGEVHLTVRVRVLEGSNKQRLADALGREVWLGALRAGAKVGAVAVVLDDGVRDGQVEFSIPGPRARR